MIVISALATLAAASAALQAAADGLGDNPAFCFGYLETRSPALAAALQGRRTEIEALFARAGPKDSTDERGFDDWRRIGRGTAKSGASDHARVAAACRRLLRMISTQ